MERVKFIIHETYVIVIRVLFSLNSQMTLYWYNCNQNKLYALHF